MANPEHVKRLKQGVDEWNAWSKDIEIVDLSCANLTFANMTGAG